MNDNMMEIVFVMAMKLWSKRVMPTLEMVEMGEKLGDRGTTPKVDLQDLICPQIFTLRHSAWTKKKFWVVSSSLVFTCSLVVICNTQPLLMMFWTRCKQYFSFLAFFLSNIWHIGALRLVSINLNLQSNLKMVILYLFFTNLFNLKQAQKFKFDKIFQC